jgi:hypothetical protein
MFVTEMQLKNKKPEVILDLALKYDDMPFIENLIIKLLNLKDIKSIELIFENINYPFDNIDGISNRISEIGNTYIFDLFYKNNKEKLYLFHDETRLSHVNYKNSFNIYFPAMINNDLNFIKHVFHNTKLSPARYSNEVFFHAIEHNKNEISDFLIKDSRILSHISQPDIESLKINKIEKIKLSNKIKIYNF